MDNYKNTQSLRSRISSRIENKKHTVSSLYIKINDVFIEHMHPNFKPEQTIEVNYYYSEGKIFGHQSVKTTFNSNWTAEQWQEFEEEAVTRLKSC